MTQSQACHLVLGVAGTGAVTALGGGGGLTAETSALLCKCVEELQGTLQEKVGRRKETIALAVCAYSALRMLLTQQLVSTLIFRHAFMDCILVLLRGRAQYLSLPVVVIRWRLPGLLAQEKSQVAPVLSAMPARRTRRSTGIPVPCWTAGDKSRSCSIFGAQSCLPAPPLSAASHSDRNHAVMGRGGRECCPKE